MVHPPADASYNNRGIELARQLAAPGAGLQETFGKYKLVKRLAFGGMAEVFTAMVHGEAGFSKPVVIKRLHPRLSEDQDFARMLIDEARITAELRHSNICQVLDLGSVEGSYFIAMEQIDGEDLRTVQDDFVRRGSRLPTEIAVYVVSEVLAGLHYAHTRLGPDGEPLNIIHRDVSPQNVLISYEGEVKIIDFGIAKARMRLVQTQAGVIKGKFRYMSPEQAAGKEIDHRTDVFAAAVVLYELLRGQPHLHNVPDTEVLRRMREAIFEPLHKRRPDLPAQLVSIVHRALDLRPRKRFQTAGAFGEALVGFLREQQLQVGRSELAEFMQNRLTTKRRQSQAWHSDAAQPAGTDPFERRPSREQTARIPPELDEQLSRSAGERAVRNADEQTKARASVALQREGSAAGTTGSGTIERQFDPGEPADGALPTTREPTATLDEEPSAPSAMSPDVVASAMSPDVVASAELPAEEAAAVRDVRGRTKIAGRTALAWSARMGEKPPSDWALDPTRAEWAEQDADGEPPDTLLDARMPQSVLQTRTMAAAGGSRQERVRETGRRLASGLGTMLILAVVLGAAGLAAHNMGLFEPEDLPSRVPGVDAGATVIEDARAEPVGTGRLRLISRPAGARVGLCGRKTEERTPTVLEAPAGRCEVVLSRRGFVTHRTTVTVPQGEQITVRASLRRARLLPRRAPPPPEQTGGGDDSVPTRGTLQVVSVQVGEVYVQGRRVGSTPRLTLQLAPGVYTVEVRFGRLGIKRTRRVRIRAGAVSGWNVDPSP